jgi:hypothetical protein
MSHTPQKELGDGWNVLLYCYGECSNGRKLLAWHSKWKRHGRLH